MYLPGTACPEATEIMQRMWTDGVSRLDWVSAEDQNEVNLRNELQRGFTTPNLAHTAAALSRNGRGQSKVTVLDPTIGTGVLAASIVIRLAGLPPADRPKWVNVIGIDRNLKYCKAARACLGDLAGWAVHQGIWVDTHVVTGDFLNPPSWTGDIKDLDHEEINADIVVINPPPPAGAVADTRGKPDQGLQAAAEQHDGSRVHRARGPRPRRQWRDDRAEQRALDDRRGQQPRGETAPEGRLHHRHPPVPAAEHQQLPAVRAQRAAPRRHGVAVPEGRRPSARDQRLPRDDGPRGAPRRQDHRGDAAREGAAGERVPPAPAGHRDPEVTPRRRDPESSGASRS